MRRHRPTSADSEPAISAPPHPEGAEAVASPTGPDRREFICGAVMAGSVVAFGWPAFARGAGEADWSDDTDWSDGLGWSS
jgi:hypothetical protein